LPTLAYQGTFAWGVLDARAYWQQTDHEMGFFTPERTGTMPMLTHGRNTGYALMASLPLAAGELRLGQEWHGFRLDDYWPAVPGSMMMGPRTYLNINDGRRDRTVLFGELETRHDGRWTSVLGLRGEAVRMDTGAVQAYGTNMMNMADSMAAAAFNARSRRQRDTNIDASAQASYTPDAASRYDFALARKVRSPSLYERYTGARLDGHDHDQLVWRRQRLRGQYRLETRDGVRRPSRPTGMAAARRAGSCASTRITARSTTISTPTCWRLSTLTCRWAPRASCCSSPTTMRPCTASTWRGSCRWRAAASGAASPPAATGPGRGASAAMAATCTA
jgi:hypothetical protein